MVSGEATKTRKPRIPRLLGLATLIVGGALIVCHAMAVTLQDSLFQFDFAVLNILTIGAIFVFTLFWLIWLLRSGLPRRFSRLLPAVIFLAGVAFLVLYQPRMRGAMWIGRWEPRFWQSRSVDVIEENETVDLRTTTEFDFPQFLGPNRNGIIENNGAKLDQLSSQCDLVWKQPIGEGWSGFAAVNGNAVTMMQQGNDELIVCYDIESGQQKWVYRYARRFDDPMGGVGPRSTPTINEGFVYALGANGMLACLDGQTGKPSWIARLNDVLQIELQQFRTPAGLRIQKEDTTVMWGRAASPLVYKDLVIVPAGGPKGGRQSSLIAFDKNTGMEQWRGGTHGISYGSPSLAEIDGATQILIVNESSVAGHDPETGQELWNHPWPGHSDSDANTSQATWLGDVALGEHPAGTKVLLSKGYGAGGQLISVERGSDGEFSTKALWSNTRVLKTKMTSPVFRLPYAWALSDGILECVDLRTGQRVWKQGRYGHGQVLLWGDQLLVHAENGALAVVEASGENYNELSRLPTIKGICWNTICVYDRYILVRSDLEAACYRLK